jgi:hypothetical protein
LPVRAPDIWFRADIFQFVRQFFDLCEQFAGSCASLSFRAVILAFRAPICRFVRVFFDPAGIFAGF